MVGIKCGKSPNDLKLSDTRLGRDRCMVGQGGGKEAAGVTETRVRLQRMA